jgi:hypothetical protein
MDAVRGNSAEDIKAVAEVDNSAAVSGAESGGEREGHTG